MGNSSSIGPDSIISQYQFNVKAKEIILRQYQIVFLIAFYTQPGGITTTTIKNAFSDLYNITTAENNLMTGKN